MTCSLSFWLQMSEPITPMDTDNCMTIHHKGASYFDSTAHLMCLFTPLLLMYSVIICVQVCNWFTHLQPE